ncbi:MAG: hypothetical protein U1C18_00680, partial [Patescibacteria group bacterium]|nr:hypothetical protein [Patescibacteria group bacterium]
FYKGGEAMLKAALPTGSLEKKTIARFAAAGWNIKRERARQALRAHSPNICLTHNQRRRCDGIRYAGKYQQHSV